MLKNKLFAGSIFALIVSAHQVANASNLAELLNVAKQRTVGRVEKLISDGDHTLGAKTIIPNHTTSLVTQNISSLLNFLNIEQRKQYIRQQYLHQDGKAVERLLEQYESSLRDQYDIYLEQQRKEQAEALERLAQYCNQDKKVIVSQNEQVAALRQRLKELEERGQQLDKQLEQLKEHKREMSC